MKRLLLVCTAAVLSACDFNAAFDAYCVNNPACTVGDGGLDDGGRGDGGMHTYAAITNLTLASTDPNSLAGHLASVTLSATTVDGGLADPETEVTFDGGSVGAFFERDGGPVSRGRLGGLYFLGSRAVLTNDGGVRRLMGQTDFTAALAGTSISTSLQRTFSGRLYSTRAGLLPAMQFICLGFEVEAVGNNSNDWLEFSADAGLRLSTDAGRLAVYGTSNCDMDPITSAALLSGPSANKFWVRTTDFDTINLNAVGPPLGPISIDVRMLPMYAALQLEDGGQVYDGGMPLRLDGGCTAATFTWRHAGQQATHTVAFDTTGRFPFRVEASGAALFTDIGCTNAPTSFPLIVTGQATATQQLSLRAMTPDASVSVSFPDGGSRTTFRLVQ